MERRRHRKRTRESFSGMQHLTVALCMERFSGLLDSGVHSDCTIIVGEGATQKRIPVHKCVLAMASPVFRAMLEPASKYEESRTGEIKITDFEENVLQSLLTFIYTGKLKIIRQPERHKSSSSCSNSECKDKKDGGSLDSDDNSSSSSGRKRKSSKSSKKVRFDIQSSKSDNDRNSEDDIEVLTPPPSPIYACETCRRPPPPPPPPPPLSSMVIGDPGAKQEIHSDLQFLFRLILAADKYQVPKLGRLCQMMITDSLSVDEVVPTLLRIQPYLTIECLRTIQSRCITLMVNDFQKYRTIEGFNTVMNDQNLRDQIFDEMSVQAQAVEKQRRLTEGFEVTCYPVYEQDWVPFKVKISFDDSALVMKAKIQEHMNSDYSFDQATKSVNAYFDEFQNQKIDDESRALCVKTDYSSTVYCERFPES